MPPRRSFFLALSLAAQCAQPARPLEQWGLFELAQAGPAESAAFNPYTDLAANVTFTHAASGAAVTSPTFFDGNATYLTFIFGGAVVLEMAYGSVLDGLWNARNHGRTFASTDWSKWKAADEEAE